MVSNKKDVIPCNSSAQYRQDIENKEEKNKAKIPTKLTLFPVYYPFVFESWLLHFFVNWLLNFREGDRILDKIRRSDLSQIFNLTKCLKPCSYTKYSLLGDRKPSHFKSKYAAFSLWASSEKARVVSEQLIYPLSSLIAEFGGTLGLFLRISFVTIWDNFRIFGIFYKYGFKQDFERVHLCLGSHPNRVIWCQSI